MTGFILTGRAPGLFKCKESVDMKRKALVSLLTTVFVEIVIVGGATGCSSAATQPQGRQQDVLQSEQL